MNSINRPLLTAISVAVLLAGCDSLHLKKTDSQNTAPITQENSTAVNESDADKKPAAPIYATAWDRIKAGYGLPEFNNTKIDEKLNFYIKNKAYFSKISQQSEPYLYYVASEMQANNIPLELALLPFIESAYNPNASSAGNVGMWQLAPVTGKTFGLKQNHWYDDRKDVISSTEAVIKLLKRLNQMFNGDWLLTIAAYNGGEGTVQFAINKNQRAGKPTDFWSLPLNKTVQGYVPQLIALSKIVADPDRYGYKLYPIADAPYFVKVMVDSQVNLADAAKNSNIDITQIKKINAGLSSWLTDPYATHALLVPVADAEAFSLQLKSLPQIPVMKWQDYNVKKGDTLDGIAKIYGVSAANIKIANNLNSNNLRIGQHLQIPLSPMSTVQQTTPSSAPAITNGNDSSQSGSSSTSQYYIVKSGDSLWSIAYSQKMSVAALAQLNNMTEKSSIVPGQKLIIRSN